MNEQKTQARNDATQRLLAAAEAADWDGALAAGRIADALVKDETDGGGWSLTAVGFDPLAMAAAHAAEHGRFDVATALLFDEFALEPARTAIDLMDSDPELAFVRLENASYWESGACRLAQAIGVRLAHRLSQGDWDQRVLAVAAAGLGKLPEEVGEERELAWAKEHKLPGAVVDIHVLTSACVRLGLRRRSGPEGKTFEGLAASKGWILADYAPALFEQAALCARRQVEDGGVQWGVLHTYALGALLHGQEAEVRQRIGALLEKWNARRSGAKRAERLARHLEQWVVRARALAEQRAQRVSVAPLPDPARFTRHPLGAFVVESGALILSDPCYEPHSDAKRSFAVTSFIDSVKRGTWRAEVVQTTRPGIDQRFVAFLVATHVEHACSLQDACWRTLNACLGVDSGMAGLFDAAHYRDEAAVANEVVPPFNEESRWYDLCYARTTGPASGGIIPFGCVSSSGLGDGAYDGWLVESSEGIVGVCLDYGLARAEGGRDE